LSTKIHAMVDALGNPLRFLLTPGQVHDLAGADALLPQMTADVLIADKAFDADDRVIRLLENPPSSRPGKTEQRHVRSTRNSTRHDTWSKMSFANSNSSAPSPPATTKLQQISSPPSISPPLQSGLIDDTP
jgi:transposase